MTKPKAKVRHYTEVPAQSAGPEAPGVTIRWIIDEKIDVAPVYALRVIQVEPGDHTPDHIHNYEHENFVIEGRGKVQIEGEWHDLGPGDVVFLPPGIRHTYHNAGETPFKFLCGIPVSRLMAKA